ncbi:MAG: hypothetical protein KAU06_04695 [Candidatus Marinimicrobia bacterium]|nr:hypothetical protein [Candidatus Neomarinimicrobiota bacterium]
MESNKKVEEITKAVEKVNQSFIDFASATIKIFINANEGLSEATLPLRMEWSKQFAKEKGFEIKLEPKSRGYRIKLRFWHWFRIPPSMWKDLCRGGHSMSDTVRITDELRYYL